MSCCGGSESLVSEPIPSKIKNFLNAHFAKILVASVIVFVLVLVVLMYSGIPIIPISYEGVTAGGPQSNDQGYFSEGVTAGGPQSNDQGYFSEGVTAGGPIVMDQGYFSEGMAPKRRLLGGILKRSEGLTPCQERESKYETNSFNWL